MSTSLARLRALGSLALDLALPPTCGGCGREGSLLCDACIAAAAIRLGRPAGEPIGLPSDIPEPLLQLEWCGPFRGPVRHALHALKYAGERRVAEPLGRLVAQRWAEVGAGGDFLVPVPVHRDRAAARGYDQAALLARAAAAELGLPAAEALARQRATIAQFDLARDERARNVAGAFGLRSPASAAAVAGRWVVLVDDVVTTGATLSACASALLEAGAVAVSAVTVARER